MKNHIEYSNSSCHPKFAVSSGSCGCGDRELVRYVGRYGAVSIDDVRAEIGLGRTAAYRRVARCIEGGLLERLDLLTDEPSVLRATRDGLRYAGLGLSVAPISPGAVRHWLCCARVAHELSVSLAQSGRDFRILTQREIPLLEAIEGKPVARVKMGRKREGSGSHWHCPDFVVFLGAEVHAIEVELTPKAPARLRQILIAWGQAVEAGRIDRVAYHCAPGQTRSAVERAAKKARSGRWLRIEEIHHEA